MRRNTPRASSRRSATRSARPVPSPAPPSAPTRWTRRMATRPCTRSPSLSRKAATWRWQGFGTRTIVAIRIDRVDVQSNTAELRRSLRGSEADADGWFDGPPYAVAETAFDEYEMEACTLQPESD